MLVSWQPWQVDWTPRAVRGLRRLTHQERERVMDAVDFYAATGRGDVARVRGRDREWRLRVGDVRIIFTLDQDLRKLIVLSVDRRDSVYR